MARNSEQLESMLADYVDGSLDAGQLETVEKAIAADPQLARQLRQMKQLRGTFASFPRAVAPPDLAEDVQSQLERNLLLGDKSGDALDPDLRISRWPQIRAMAAVVALAAGLGLLVWSMLPQTGGPSVPSIALRDLPDLERPPVTLRERAAEDTHDTDPNSHIFGGAADNILPRAEQPPATPPADLPPMPSTAVEAGVAGENRVARTPNADEPRIVWRALRSGEALALPEQESAFEETGTPEALVAIAEKNGADMLVLINTAAPLEAHEALNGYLAQNAVAFDRISSMVDGPRVDQPEEAPGSAKDEGTNAGARRFGGFWGLGDRRKATEAQEFKVVVARGLTVEQTAEIAQVVLTKQPPAKLNYYARLPADEPAPDMRGVYQQRAQRQQAVQRVDRDQLFDADQVVAADDVLLIDLPAVEGVPASRRVRVAADGAIDVPGVGRIPVSGLSLEQIAELVQARIVQTKQDAAPGRVVVRRPALPVPIVQPDAPAGGGGPQLQAGLDDAMRVDVAIAIQPDSSTPAADPAIEAPAAAAAPATQPSTQPAAPEATGIPAAR